MRKIHRQILTAASVLLVGTAVILGSLALSGFPAPSEPSLALTLGGLVLLTVLIIGPLVIS